MKFKVNKEFYLRGTSYKRGDEIELTEEQSIRLSDYVDLSEVKIMDSPPKDKMIKKSKNKGGIRG